jgi:predicted nucleic acid-binding protein
VDYQDLKKETIKDKFPLPMVEELLDELHEAYNSPKISNNLSRISCFFIKILAEFFLIQSITSYQQFQH